MLDKIIWLNESYSYISDVETVGHVTYCSDDYREAPQYQHRMTKCTEAVIGRFLGDLIGPKLNSQFTEDPRPCCPPYIHFGAL